MATLDDIDLNLSFVLGWHRRGSSISLFLELALGPGHPGFREYDRRQAVASYSLAVMKLEGVTEVAGLDENRVPVWDDELADFEELGEIQRAEFDGKSLKLVVEDLDEIEVECERAEINLVASGPHAFDDR